MGEFLSSLLRGFVHFLWLLLIASGMYASASLLSADFQRDEWRAQYSQALRYGQRYQAREIARRWNDWSAVKLAWEAAQRPSVVLVSMKKLGSQLLPKRLNGGGRGLLWTPQILVQHVAVPFLVALLFGYLLEYGAYPFARARLARWLADPNEQPFGSKMDLTRGDGFVLSREVRLDRSVSFRHALTIGPSGSSKSASQVIPSLLQLPDDCAAVVSDLKFELYCRSVDWLISRGHPVYVLAPAGGFGRGWDPLHECDCADDARELARQILGASAAISGQTSSEWESMSESLLATYLVESQQRGQGLIDGIEKLYASAAGQAWIESDPAKFDLAMFQSMAQSEKTVASVYATVQKSLRPWTRDQVAGFLCNPSRVDTRSIRKQRAVVFLCSTAQESAQLAAVQNVFWQRLFATLGTQSGQPACYCLLDEFANIGRLEGVDRALNLLRGAGCGIHACIQNPPQIEGVYGPQFGRLVRASFGTVSVLPGLRDGADEVAKWLGSKEDVRDTYSTTDERLRSTHTSQKQDVLSAELVRQLRDDQVLIVSGNRKPVISKTRPWYKIKRLAAQVPAVFRRDWNHVDQGMVRKCLDATGTIKARPLKVSSTKPQPVVDEKTIDAANDSLAGLFDEFEV